MREEGIGGCPWWLMGRTGVEGIHHHSRLGGMKNFWSGLKMAIVTLGGQQGVGRMQCQV